MGFFSRRSRPEPEADAATALGADPSSDGADDRFPALDRPGADLLVRLVLSRFAEAGVEASADVEGTVLSAGGQTRLHNLSHQVAHAPQEQWAAMVDEFCGVMIPLVEGAASPELSPDVALSRLLPRLIPADSLPVEPAYTRPYAGDLRVFMCLDHPTHVQTLTSIDDLGDVAELEPVALANLRALPRPEVFPLAEDDGSGQVFVFSSDDFFGATRALVLEDLLRDQVDVDLTVHGVLVAIPNRNVLAAHVLTGSDFVVAINTLIGIARGQHEAQGPVSPHLFYRAPDGRVEQVTRDTENGVSVMATGLLGEGLAALGLLED